jgi:hypothetical protein
VELERAAFQEAMRVLALEVRPSPVPLEHARRLFRVPSVRAYPAESGPAWHPEADQELTRAYLRWCERRSKPGDCLHLLEGGSTLNRDGRYALAMALALDSVWDEAAEALGDMVNPEAVLATIASAGAMYFTLWVLPEPASKFLAATLTMALAGYLGFDTLWGLIGGWVQLVEEADRAPTFDALRTAGARYGKVMGKNAARIFVMLTTAAVGSTGAQLAQKLPKLPGSGQAAKLLMAETGIRYGAIAEVQSVAVNTENVVISLAPGAVAMTASGTGGDGGAISAANDAKKLTPEQQRAIRSLEKQLRKHEEKLKSFRENPTPRPGTEDLSPEIQKQSIEGRLRHLEREIETFKKNIEKIQQGGG